MKKVDSKFINIQCVSVIVDDSLIEDTLQYFHNYVFDEINRMCRDICMK